jgi:Tfp pilus assembly protein PilF
MVMSRLVRCTFTIACSALSLALALGLAAAGASHAATTTPAAPFRPPYVPASDDERLQQVPSVADPAVANMRLLRARLDAAPGSLPAALQLADAYVDYSRQIGDAHFAGYAEAVIAPWTAHAAPPAAALLTLATIQQYRHQFKEARDLLRTILQLQPRNGQARLTLATLDMVQGDYAAAGKGCAQVASNAGFELGLACVGNLRSYVGQAHQSLALLHQAEASGSRVSPAYQAWVQGLIAESAERLGDWPLAETHYLAALKLLPRDNFLLVAYADFLLDRGRPREVLELLADHAQSDTAFLRMALAQSALHSADATRYSWIMAARFEALALRGSDYFGREQARFALQLQHDPQTSLDLARRNWQVQRAPWDARVVLEAALAAHQPRAAVQVLDFLDATKLEDPIIQPLAKELRSQLNGPAGGSR